MSKKFTSLRTAALALAAVSLLSGCQSLKNFFWGEPEIKNPYADAYRDYESPCVIGSDDHSPTLDVMLLNAMKDRGLKPQLIDEKDTERLKSCRITVRFSVEGGDSFTQGVEGMSLFYRDHKTGETYWVGIGKRNRFNMPELSSAAAEARDPQVIIRQLVERLFPERLISE